MFFPFFSAWIEGQNIKPYLPFKEKLVSSCKSAPFKEAVEQIEAYIRDPDKYQTKYLSNDSPDPDEEFDKLRESDTLSDSSIKVEMPSPKLEFVTPIKKATPVRKSKTAEKATVVKSTPVAEKRGSARKRGPSHDEGANSDDHNNDVASSPVPAPPPKRKRISAAAAVLNHSGITADDSPTTASSEVSFTRRAIPTSALLNRPSPQPLPEQPEVDMSQISQTLKSKNIKPSKLRFGFLGLGIMGCGIVKNLINSGHNVVVWNRTSTKCRAFSDAGALVGTTPSDVVDMTDITFSCVADPQAAKDVSNWRGLLF